MRDGIWWYTYLLFRFLPLGHCRILDINSEIHVYFGPGYNSGGQINKVLIIWWTGDVQGWKGSWHAGGHMRGLQRSKVALQHWKELKTFWGNAKERRKQDHASTRTPWKLWRGCSQRRRVVCYCQSSSWNTSEERRADAPTWHATTQSTIPKWDEVENYPEQESHQPQAPTEVHTGSTKMHQMSCELRCQSDRGCLGPSGGVVGLS